MTQDLQRCQDDAMMLHDMETLSALPALCEGNPAVTGGSPQKRASNVGFDNFSDFGLNS